MAKPRLEGISFLRGISIFLVVVIHFIAGLPLQLFGQHEWQPVFITFDQLGRVAVPIFLAASGYLLEKKYSAGKLNTTEFWLHRFQQILPLYIFWSLVLFGLRVMVPVWNQPPVDFTLYTVGKILLFGQGDYHLYFVPLLLQMYLLYPLLRLLLARFPKPFLVFTFIVQALLFIFIEQHTSSNTLPGFFQSDGQQYLLFLNWWFYFVLGMFFVGREKSIRRFGLFWAGATLVTGLISAFDAYALIDGGRDPLFALRFTRLPILFYTSSFLFFAWSYLERLPQHIPPQLRSVFVKLGDNSFLVYLAHTIVLRLGLGIWYGQIDWLTFIVGSLATLLALFLSFSWSSWTAWWSTLRR